LRLGFAFAASYKIAMKFGRFIGPPEDDNFRVETPPQGHTQASVALLCVHRASTQLALRVSKTLGYSMANHNQRKSCQSDQSLH
jgi:hypothetical protein